MKQLEKCKNAMNFSKLREQELRRNHDKLFNEAQRLDKKSDALDRERILIANDIRQTTLEIEQYRAEVSPGIGAEPGLVERIEEIQGFIKAEKESADVIQKLIKKANQELLAQTKERDRFKNEATKAKKISEQLESRVAEWIKANGAFLGNLGAATGEMP